MEKCPEDIDKLSHVLRDWRVTPQLPPRFQEHVWRRISRSEAAPKVASLADSIRSLRTLLGRPRVAFAYVSMLVALGIASGSWTAQVKSNQLEKDLEFRYVQLVDPSIAAGLK